MPTQDEKNLALNRFMGWIAFDLYADTPGAREWTRLLKDEFVRRTGSLMKVDTWPSGLFKARIRKRPSIDDGQVIEVELPVESHAILDAIYEAIRNA